MILQLPLTHSRTFFCEITSQCQPFATEFPSMGDHLPSEIELLDRNESADIKPMMSLPVSALTSGGIGSFGRQAQAAYLLDQLLTAIKIIDIEVKQAELFRIDGELQSFLSIVINQCRGTWGLYCGSIAMTIRYVDMFVGLSAT